MSHTSRLRCFVALDLPLSLQAEALSIQEQLRKKDLFQGRFTVPENIHLTLKFLGGIDRPQATEVATLLQGVVAPPCTVKLDGAGMFAPRIIWLKLNGADSLQQQVDQTLASLFPQETRFMGHITIARVKKAPQPCDLAKAVQSLKVSPLLTRVDSFSLRQSTLNPEGPRYQLLKQFSFADH